MIKLFTGIYNNKKVFLTGHTGFKGSWLAFWLSEMGADVYGYALAPDSAPNHFELVKPDISSQYADVRDAEKLQQAVSEFRPDIVFHLAAQPLVRKSYREPLETVSTNIIGTANLFEACRKVDSVKAIVNVTSDKCYDNNEWVWGYRECDPMGGHDPYSASKGCSELLTASWRKSFFNPAAYGKTHQTLLASARAGNVIGGGDWCEDRLIPDIIRAVMKNETVVIRSPNATRPWQHVLEPLGGYLLLGQKLLEGKKECAEAWNFGPANEASITVGEVVRHIKSHWPSFDYEIRPDSNQPHEANLLRLDCSKAYAKLNWIPVWDSETTFAQTTDWYREYCERGVVLTTENLAAYVAAAADKGIEWLKDS